MSRYAERILIGLCVIAIAILVVRDGAVSAQSSGLSSPIPAASGATAIINLCAGMANLGTSQTALIDDNSITAGNTISKCRSGVVTAPFIPVTQLYWDLVPSLFGTSTAVGGVYFVPTNQTIKSIITRIAGSPICTAAPSVVILDLGTSPTTVYGSATVLTTLATSTSNGVFNNPSLNIALTSGHYIGYGLSAGTCVTAPTITTTIAVV